MLTRPLSFLMAGALALSCQGCGSSTGGSSAAGAAPRLSTPSGRVNLRASAPLLAVFTPTSDWGSGFVAEIKLTNTGSAPVANWQLDFDFPRSIDSIWNAQIAQHAGSHYRLAAVSYNAVMAPGQSITLGFQGTPGLGGVQPTNLQASSDSSGPGPAPSSSPSASASPSPSPSPSATPTAGVRLRYSTINDWGGGFTGQVEIANQSSAPLTDWELQLSWDRTLVNVWNGVLSGQDGATIRIHPADYNRSLAPGAIVTVGFQGQPGNVGAGPTQVRLVGAGQPAPSPSASASSSPLPNPSPGGKIQGWLHTQGTQLIDSQGHVVRLTGVNWFGMETNTYCPHGLWARNLDDMVAQMASQGYNCIRLPYCNQLFDAGSQPNSINSSLNPTLTGLSGLQIMDRVVASAGAHGMKVLLDRHRPDSGGQSELWYTGAYSEERWISDWEMLARRYSQTSTVIGCDLHNEPHGSASWGDGNPATDWQAAAKRAGDRILAANPNLLIVVEGIENVSGDSYWWGGNLRAAGARPVLLNLPGHLVYSAHDYPSTVYAQSWFSDPSYPNNLTSVWDSHWGYLVRTGQAPVLVGEFGTKYQTASDQQWLNKLVPYMSSLGASWTYWSWNPNSTDTGGLLQDDWTHLNLTKQAVLAPGLF